MHLGGNGFIHRVPYHQRGIFTIQAGQIMIKIILNQIDFSKPILGIPLWELLFFLIPPIIGIIGLYYNFYIRRDKEMKEKMPEFKVMFVRLKIDPDSSPLGKEYPMVKRYNNQLEKITLYDFKNEKPKKSSYVLYYNNNENELKSTKGNIKIIKEEPTTGIYPGHENNNRDLIELRVKKVLLILKFTDSKNIYKYFKISFWEYISESIGWNLKAEKEDIDIFLKKLKINKIIKRFKKINKNEDELISSINYR